MAKRDDTHPGLVQKAPSPLIGPGWARASPRMAQLESGHPRDVLRLVRRAPLPAGGGLRLGNVGTPSSSQGPIPPRQAHLGPSEGCDLVESAGVPRPFPWRPDPAADQPQGAPAKPADLIRPCPPPSPRAGDRPRASDRNVSIPTIGVDMNIKQVEELLLHHWSTRGAPSVPMPSLCRHPA